MRRYNYGIALLKYIAAFAVVCIHYSDKGVGVGLSVPIYMFLAFELSSEMTASALGKRLLRIYAPYLFWGAISIVCAWVLTKNISTYKVCAQLFVGHAYCTPLYFLFLLAAFSVLFFVVGSRWYIHLLILLVCIGLQYSGVNFHFCSALPYEYRYPIGRMAELYPAAVLGWLYSRGRKNVGNVFMFDAVVCAGMLACGCVTYVSGLHLPPGFAYSGIPILCVSGALCVAFTAMGESIHCESNVLRNIFTTSSCIYYCHMIVGSFLMLYLKCVSMTTAIIVWFCSFLLALGLQRIKVLQRVVQ